mmetsp:Transcript_14178/g.34285  ORF Transcript_14178/g.34285 Transcript_14178/m.34285 type:complete len:80 (-) Transcript_14178:700-939(-)
MLCHISCYYLTICAINTCFRISVIDIGSSSTIDLLNILQTHSSSLSDKNLVTVYFNSPNYSHITYNCAHQAFPSSLIMT